MATKKILSVRVYRNERIPYEIAGETHYKAKRTTIHTENLSPWCYECDEKDIHKLHKQYKQHPDDIVVMTTRSKYLTLEEAKEKLKKGKRLTHVAFAPEEWITQKDNLIILENDLRFKEAGYWACRQDKFWSDGWIILDDLKPIKDEVQRD